MIFTVNSVKISVYLEILLLISASNGSKVFVNLRLYSLVEVNKWSNSDPTKNFYLNLLSDNFSTKDDLFRCASQLYRVKTYLLAKNKN